MGNGTGSGNGRNSPRRCQEIPLDRPLVFLPGGRFACFNWRVYASGLLSGLRGRFTTSLKDISQALTKRRFSIFPKLFSQESCFDFRTRPGRQNGDYCYLSITTFPPPRNPNYKFVLQPHRTGAAPYIKERQDNSPAFPENQRCFAITHRAANRAWSRRRNR